MYDDVVLVIPSYEPDDKLCAYVKNLKNSGINNIIVVNDGSNKKYDTYFNDAENNGAIVISYDVNKGKGYALKTAFSYIKKSNKKIRTIVTADSDGQHTVEDVFNVINALESSRDSLILGSRDFNLSHVPFKSRFGNKLTSIVYKLFYGQYLPDTQTGLRAFDIKYIDHMLRVNGDRFEYEMNMLIYFSNNKFNIKPEIIETIYENNNEGTHFHPIRDSIKIYKVIFSNIFKFMSSSILSTLIDITIFSILIKCFSTIIFNPTHRIFVSGFIARTVSSLFNFLFNKKFVFNINASTTKNRVAFFRYIIIVLIIITSSNTLTSLFHFILNISEIIIKPIIDVSLFFLSYRLQKNWVFKNI